MSTFGRSRLNDLQWEQFKNSVTITNCPHEEIHWTKVRAQLEEDLKTCIECNTPCFNSVWEIYQHHLTWSFPHGLPRLTKEIQEEEAFSAFANGKMLFVTMTTLVLASASSAQLAASAHHSPLSSDLSSPPSGVGSTSTAPTRNAQ